MHFIAALYVHVCTNHQIHQGCFRLPAANHEPYGRENCDLNLL